MDTWSIVKSLFQAYSKTVIQIWFFLLKMFNIKMHIKTTNYHLSDTSKAFFDFLMVALTWTNQNYTWWKHRSGTQPSTTFLINFNFFFFWLHCCSIWCVWNWALLSAKCLLLEKMNEKLMKNYIMHTLFCVNELFKIYFQIFIISF